MVPSDDDHKDTPEVDSATSTKEHTSGRLTRMPDCLMKWWIPFGLAVVLLIICTPIAFWWGGHFHWPSSAAMTLCATIAGTGFAFSAWQQRSSDNATRELERATETLWHMRNTAHELLSANSYYDQYEGICRYFELADQLNKSIQKESNTTRILNSAILSALCAHIRYLGDPLPNNFENENERGELQNLILNNILERINTNLKGYWDGMSINLTDTIFLTPISITNFTSSSMIHFNHSTFNHKVNLEIFQKATLLWKYATFHSQLTVTGQPKGTNNEKPVLHQDNFPTKIISSQFENISICVFGDVTHQITPKGTSTNASNLYFKACNFLRGKSTQHQSQEVTEEADTTFLDEGKVTEPPDNYIWATISFNFTSIRNECTTKLYFADCIFGRIDPIKDAIIPSTNFTGCTITQNDKAECTKNAPQNLNFFECNYAPTPEPQALHDDREENW